MGRGEIRSQADVQRLFQAIVPDLVAAFTELANDPSLAPSALSSVAAKGGGNSSSVGCPEDGTINVNLDTGEAVLTNCTARGVTISGSVMLFISPGPPFHQANFSGTLMVSGTFTGTIQVVTALIQWTDPATDDNTFWDVTVILDGMQVTVSSGDTGSGDACAEYEPPGGPGSVPPGGQCDDGSDCQSNSCRDPIENPTEGCTCRNLRGTDCSSCIGVNAAPEGFPSNAAVECTDAGDFSCDCVTQSGETLPFYPSGAGECFY